MRKHIRRRAILCIVLSLWIQHDAAFSWHVSRLARSFSLSTMYSQSEKANPEARRQESLKQGHDPIMSLNINLDALAQSKDGAPRAQELLQRIEALYKEGYYEAFPDTISYNTVLKAWKENNRPREALDLLQHMINNSEITPVRPNVISFNTVILAFARRGDYKQCLELLNEMERIGGVAKPDIVTYNAILHAYAQSNENGAAQKAEKLLKDILNPEVPPEILADTTSFNTVISAWSQAANPFSVDAANHAQKLLDHMEIMHAAGCDHIRPDVYSYNSVISAWAKSGAADRASEVMSRMLQRDRIVPNRVSYSALMSAFAKSGDPQKAQDILDIMLKKYAKGNRAMKPDTVAFSSVVDGWAKAASVQNPDAADQALSLLEKMKSLKQDGMGPNARTYTSVISAIGRAGRWEAGEAALELVKDMEAEYARGDTALRPTTIHYNALLNAIARSPRADKALTAATILRTMKDHELECCHPDIISLNTLLLACANAFGDSTLKQRSFQIALHAFQEAMDMYPTSTTFAHMLKSTRRLAPKAKSREILRMVFRRCCQKGLINGGIISQVQMCCKSDKEWEDLVGDEVARVCGRTGKTGLSSLPKTFVRNARR